MIFFVFLTLNVTWQLSRELSSSEVSEGIGVDEDASSTLEGDAGEEVHSGGTLVSAIIIFLISQFVLSQK